VTSLEAAQTIILTSAMKCILLSFLIAENARGFLSKKNARGFIEYYPICFNMYYVRRMLISFSYSNECVTDRLDSEFVITETA
jgi:hypothetical protein